MNRIGKVDTDPADRYLSMNSIETWGLIYIETDNTMQTIILLSYVILVSNFL